MSWAKIGELAKETARTPDAIRRKISRHNRRIAGTAPERIIRRLHGRINREDFRRELAEEIRRYTPAAEAVEALGVSALAGEVGVR